MNVTEEAQLALADGFEDIISEFELPRGFPDDVLAEVDESIARGGQAWANDRYDATDIPFATLDPATSTDLDQAFAISQQGKQLVLHYALADVGAFVSEDSRVEKEAWQRGVTIYGLTEKIPLYPKSISQRAASLLPDGPRPAYLVEVSVDAMGDLQLLAMRKAIVASRRKLAYDNVDLKTLPHIEAFASRIWKNEDARGTIRVEFPQQEVVSDDNAPGGVRLELRARNFAETVNSTLSLATNIAIGELFRRSKIGLFRVMDEPSSPSIGQLRRTAHAVGIQWPRSQSLRELQRKLDPTNASHQRFLLEARRSGGRASYATFAQDNSPWHSAIGATYAHATAPMRRLADRYVLDLAYHLANTLEVPSALIDRIDRLPDIMQRYERRANSVDRAVIDLLEAVSLQHRVGEVLKAEIVDAEHGIVQTIDSAIRSRVLQLPRNAKDGQFIDVRIESAIPAKRLVVLKVT
jgi:VacB/RNase II family 3'-5' exoribonuclease